ncbi:MAG: hypothetical protein LBM62_03045, partial [Mediterranea sp.]|nr:hypothetical protein [Mediterranea sp.]
MIKYILPALLSALLVSACSSSEPEFVRDASSEKKVVFSISVTQGGASATRASVGDDEKVTEVDVLAFRKENGNYYYAYHSVGSSTATDGGNIKSFTAKAYTLKGNQQFVVIANAHDEVARITANLTERDNWSKEQLLRLLQLNLGDKVWGETSGSINRFPLWGETGDMAVTATTTIPNIAQVLIRMTVRIDVALSSSAGKVFRLTSLRLYNRNTVGRIAPISTSDYWDSTGNTILKPSIAGNPSDNYKPYKVEKGPQVYTYSESTGEPAKCTIYTPEYEAPPLTDYTNAACLVIGGKYAPDGNFDAVTAESYYRIDFTETISGTVKLLDLLRNHLYEITVNSVTGSGQNDPDNAFLSKTANLDATVQPWNLVHLGDMIFDKDSYLSVKHGRMAFNQDDKRVDASLHDNVITVETDYLSTDANYPDGWYIEKVIYKGGDADKPWLTLHKVDDNSVVTVGRGTDNANVKPAKTPYSFYTKFDANNTKKERSAQFVFVAGHLSYKLTVSQAANNEVNIVLTNDAGHVLSGGDTMLFEANNNGVPAVQKLRVEWHPANYPLKVEVATVAGKGGFTTGMIKPATLSSPEGSHTYLLSPSAIESKDDNEWNGRAVTVTFTVLTAAGETTSSTKSIVLKQMNYQLTTDISESAYVMDENDGVDNFKLTTNFKWRAEFFESDNPTEKSTLVRIDEPN